MGDGGAEKPQPKPSETGKGIGRRAFLGGVAGAALVGIASEAAKKFGFGQSAPAEAPKPQPSAPEAKPTAVPTSTPFTEARPIQTVTAQETRRAPRSQDVAHELTPDSLDRWVGSEKVAVNDIKSKIEYASNFKMGELHMKELAPNIREVVTKTGRVIEVSLHKEFLRQAGTNSIVYVELTKSVDTPTGGRKTGPVGRLKLEPTDLARIYNEQNKVKKTDRFAFYVNEGGIDSSQHPYQLDNVINADTEYQQGKQYGMSFYFNNGASDFVENAQGQMETRQTSGNPALIFNFARK